MRSVKRQIAEPRPLCRRMSVYEIDRSVGKQVGRVCPISVQFVDAFEQVVLAAVNVVVIVDVAGSMSDEFVEPSLSRSRAFCKSDVPLAKTSSDVGHGRRLQHLRNKSLLRIETNAIVSLQPGQLVDQSVTLRDPSCQQACPRHRTSGGRSVKGCQLRAFGRQLIKSGAQESAIRD